MSNVYDDYGIKFSLYPKQQLFLAHPDYTKNIEGYQTPKEVLFGGAAGSAKAEPLSSKVCTPFGFKRMGDMKIGDLVNNPDGSIAKVLEIHPQGVKDIYKVTFSDGATVRCTEDHLWLVHFTRHKIKANRKYLNFSNSEGTPVRGRLATTTELMSFLSKNNKNKSYPVIPLTEPVQFTRTSSQGIDYLLPIDPYALGALIGDGCLVNERHITFTTADEEILHNIENGLGVKLIPYKNKYSYGVPDRGGKLKKALVNFNLLGKKSIDKHIPENYLYASIDSRWALLQGLMDTDGCGYATADSAISYSTVSRQLAIDMKFLVESLGGRCTVTENNAGYKNKVNEYIQTNNVFNCYIQFPNGEKVFRLTRKKELCKTKFNGGNSPLSRRMISIEYDGQEEAQCITVDHPNGLYLTDNFVVTHNSFSLRAISVILAIECPGVQIYLFRRTYSELTSNHLLGPNGYRAWLATAMKKKLVRIDSSENIIYFRNGPAGGFEGGSQIYLRHMQHDKDMFLYQGAEIHILMIDEATHFSPEVYYFLRSRVRLGSWAPPEKWAEYFPRIMMGSNPGGPAHLAFKKMFVDFVDPANPYQPKWAPTDDGGMLRQYIPGTVYDNPALLVEDPGYIDRLKGLGSPELVKAMLEGDWNIVAGGMFDDVWDTRYVVMPPFKIPNNWYINRGFDWGSAVPFACVWFAESNGEEVELSDGTVTTFPRGTLFAIEELYGNNPNSKNPDAGIMLSNQEIGYRIKDKENNSPVLRHISHKILAGPADNQIFNIMSNDTISRGLNEGYWGSATMKDVDIFFRSDKSQGSRVKRWSLMRDRFSAVLSLRDGKPMENAGLIIFNNCSNIIRTLPTLPRKANDLEDIMDGVPITWLMLSATVVCNAVVVLGA